MTSKTKAFRQLVIVDNTEYIKFDFQKSSAGTIHIVKDREKLEENSCISLREMTYDHCHDLGHLRALWIREPQCFPLVAKLTFIFRNYSSLPQHTRLSLSIFASPWKKKIAPQTMWETNQFSELLSLKYLTVSLKWHLKALKCCTISILTIGRVGVHCSGKHTNHDEN